MTHISNSVEAAHYDESSAKLTNTLKRLNGVSKERVEWLGRASFPRTDSPPPDNDEKTTLYNREVLVSLAEAVESLQGQLRELKSSSSKGTSSKKS